MTPIISKIGLPVVLAFMIVEGLVSWFMRDDTYDKAETRANLLIGLVGNVLGRLVWSSLGFLAYDWAYSYAPVHFDMGQVSSWIALVLFADLAWYVEHRVGHEVRLMWAIHSVHHSSEKYNYSVALRLPWLGGLTRIPFLMPLAFAGFPPVAVFTGFSIVFLYQVWVHTQYVGKLGILESVLNTPSHHRVHHASNSLYIDKNYGGIFIFWDKWFGTFEEETEQPRYGITKPINTSNPVKINFQELLQVAHDVCEAPNLRAATQKVVGRP